MLGCRGMLVNTKQMVGVSVVTRSGQPVGKVHSFNLDVATGQMMHLCVKTRGLVAELLQTELCIDATSVIELSLDRVVVADAVIKVRGVLARKDFKPVSSVTGVMGRE